jgi:membrane-bound lytic murein transglycosylase B
MEAANKALLSYLEARFRVPGPIILAIWGIETSYGTNTGGFGVIEALATLAWDGRRSSYFRSELMAALRILDGGHISPERMRGSWAGAMGQPQFMPTSFEQMAVDADGDGRKDIWDSRADALGSIANYLFRNGWRDGGRWGTEVLLPPGFDTSQAARENIRPLWDWMRLGVATTNTRVLANAEEHGAILIPGLKDGDRQAFLVFNNFSVIRRYNSSNFYALTVGLLSDRLK